MKSGDLVRLRNEKIAMIVSDPIKRPLVGTTFQILKGENELVWVYPEDITPIPKNEKLDQRED